MRFRYSTTESSQREQNLIACRESPSEAIGLVDSGATINVMPYDMRLQLGAIWEDNKAIIQLSGNLGNQPVLPLLAMAQIGDIVPIQLAFAWTKQLNTPLILGQTNFFMEFDGVFTVPRWDSRLSLNLCKQ